jgi:lipopolysaccharide heptosyltransferase II
VIDLAASERWADARRILAVRLDALGDVVMTTPAIRALATSAPGRQVTLLTSASGAAIASMIPEIDDVIVYDAPWMKATRQREGPGPDLEMIEGIRRGTFDAAVVFTVYSQNPLPAAMLCYLAGIPLRLAHSRERAYGLLTDRIPEREPEQVVRHEVRRQLDLVAAVGATTSDERLHVVVPSLASHRVRRALEREGVDRARPWVVVHPGATAPSRRYAPSSFAAVADALALEHGWTIVFAGGPGDVELVGSIRSTMRAPSMSLAGDGGVESLAALLELAPVVIANNSGPAHLAAAVGTPVVDLYALTNPQHTPWGVPSRILFHDVACRFCYSSVCPERHHDCLRLVSPGDVVAAALELARGSGERSDGAADATRRALVPSGGPR